ncbi:MAG: acyltransferase [Pseudomonadota bacterium]
MSTILQLIGLLFPWSLRRRLLNLSSANVIHREARIGLSLVRCDRLELGRGVRIGHFNVIKGLSQLTMGESASIGHWNWISGYPLSGTARFHGVDRDPSLHVGDHSAITQHHRFDVSDRLEIGSFSIVAGYATQILTHAINVEASRQDVAPVTIGSYSFIGTRCVILPGSGFPSRSVLAAGAVLASTFSDEYVLYGGVPAKTIKTLPEDAAFFSRSSGHVD